MDNKGDAPGLRERLAELNTLGVAADFSPDEAELIGAFREDSLSEAEALASLVGLNPSMVDDEGDEG